MLSYLLALGGTFGAGVGSVLQSIGVRRAGAYGGDHTDLTKVARQPLYWAGLGTDIIGFACGAIALQVLPLFLVQSVTAASIGVTAVLSTFLGIVLSRQGWISLAVVGVGLVLLATSAEPGRAVAMPESWRWMLFALVVPVVLLVWIGGQLTGKLAAPVMAFASGVGFAAVAVSARSMPAPTSVGDLLTEPALWAVVVNGVAAAVAFAMALQQGSATTVSAVMFTTNTVVPSAIGMLLLGDSFRQGFVGAGLLGFVLAVGGVITLAHYADVATQEHEAELETEAA